MPAKRLSERLSDTSQRWLEIADVCQSWAEVAPYTSLRARAWSCRMRAQRYAVRAARARELEAARHAG